MNIKFKLKNILVVGCLVIFMIAFLGYSKKNQLLNTEYIVKNFREIYQLKILSMNDLEDKDSITVKNIMESEIDTLTYLLDDTNDKELYSLISDYIIQLNIELEVENSKGKDKEENKRIVENSLYKRLDILYTLIDDYNLNLQIKDEVKEDIRL
ncbi:MAG: hypothetical protein RRZ84_05560 [Romboutsia sp.]